MKTEWEAKFLDIERESLRNRIRQAGGVLEKAETLYKRTVYLLPKGHEIEGGWVRVRDEGDKTTMSLKVVTNGDVAKQKEVMLEIDNFENARIFLMGLGCVEKAFQESKREIWRIGKVELTIDEWPYVEPYLEIEGESEEAIKKVAEKLGFEYSEALFGSVDQVIAKKYGIPEKAVNDLIPRIVFGEPNPYLKWKEEQGR